MTIQNPGTIDNWIAQVVHTLEKEIAWLPSLFFQGFIDGLRE